MPGSSGVIKITLNGKPFDPDSIEGAIVEMLVDHLREHLGSIRHPETGEFPTIAVTGSDLSNLVCHVEGSPELLALVNAWARTKARKLTASQMMLWHCLPFRAKRQLHF